MAINRAILTEHAIYHVIFWCHSAAWTNLPGVEMQSGSHNLSGSKVLQVRGNQIEFVLNDGAGQWDTPDPYGSSQNKNYQVDAPGKYRLQGGKLERLG